MQYAANMRKRLSAERENAVLKTYFVLTQVQGLRGIPAIIVRIRFPPCGDLEMDRQLQNNV